MTAVTGVDICITCTTSQEYLFESGAIRPGTFVAGVGVDAEHKRELPPTLLATHTVVTDVTSQCATFGDLHHALDAGVMAAADVHAQLGEIVAGRRRGRSSRDEVIILDSTGMALQDAAAAAAVFERAESCGRGVRVRM